MQVIAFLLVGLIAGWIASLVIEGHGLGVVGDMIVGVIGALIGGFIFNLMGISIYGFWESVGTSAVGAAVFLFILSLFNRHDRTKRFVGP